MPQVEVFEEGDAPLFVREFEFLPRVGEYLSVEAGGHFRYLNIVEVWHREMAGTGNFRACVRVKLDD